MKNREKKFTTLSYMPLPLTCNFFSAHTNGNGYAVTNLKMSDGKEGLAFKFYLNAKLYFFDIASKSFTMLLHADPFQSGVPFNMASLGSGNLLLTYRSFTVVYFSANNSVTALDRSTTTANYNVDVPSMTSISSAYFGCN